MNVRYGMSGRLVCHLHITMYSTIDDDRGSFFYYLKRGGGEGARGGC